MSQVTIDRRYCGPPEIGQGGYVAGVLAEALGGSDVEVSLRAPAPLAKPLSVKVDGDTASLISGGALIASAVRDVVTLDVPPAPSLDNAILAAEHFDRSAHLYPGCFVCGPGRAEGDGWRIFPGPLGDGRVAAPWTPPGDGDLEPHLVWAALDCPGYFAVQGRAGKALLAGIAAHIAAPVPGGEPLIIQGWDLGSDGRKHRAATALHAADGTLLAFSKQLWVSVG